jgi:hypothetical protein
MGSRETTTAIGGRDPGHETRLGSIGVVTLDPHERSIGDRLGVGGVVGTEVAVAGRYKVSAPRIVPLWATTASAKAREPSSSGPAARGLAPRSRVSSREVRVGTSPCGSLGIGVLGHLLDGQIGPLGRGQQAARQLRRRPVPSWGQRVVAL